MGVTLTTPTAAHGGLNWDTNLEANLAALRDGINVAANINSTDLNTVTQSGIYIGNTLTSSPGVSSDTFAVTVVTGGGLTVQTAVRLGDGVAWVRKNSGAWSTWREIQTVEDTGWITSGTGITAAAGWTLTSAAYRILNGVAYLSVQLSKTGSSVAADANGALPNTSLVNLPAAIQPSRSNGNYASVGSNTTILAGGYASSTTNTIVLTAAAAGRSIASGAVIDLMGSHVL